MFKLTKIDGESHELIPNAKFTIKKINIDRNGNRTETDAVDVNENIVGEDEEINGVSYKIIKTNEKGEIVENLPSGYYKIVEIESAEGYVLDNNEEDRTYYFGIDQGKAAEVDLSNVEINLYDEENGVVEFVDVAPTNNNGYIKIGYCNGRITIPAYKTVSGEKIFIKDSSKNEAIIVKYNYEDKVEWAFCITSNINSKVYRIIKLQNNNYMVVGQIGQAKINGEKTATGEEIDLTRGTHNNEQAVYFIINEEGKVVEAKRYTTNLTTGSSYLKNVLEVDDGYVFSGMTKTDMLFDSTETVSGEEILLTTNSSTVFQPFIIKTDKFGNIKETFIMNSDNESRISEMVISNENTGYVFVGQIAKGNLVISEEYSNNNESYEINPASAHAYIAKVSENLKLEWINISEGGGNNSFNGICNNGSCYVAVGQSTGAYYISGENTVDGNSISGTSGAHGLFAVYNNEGKAEKFYATSDVGTFARVTKNDNKIVVIGITSCPNSGYDPTIILYDSNDYSKLLSKNIPGPNQSGYETEEYNAICILENGEYIVCGNIRGSVEVETNSGTKKILKKITAHYDSNLNLLNVNSEEPMSCDFKKIFKTGDGNYIGVGTLSGKMRFDESETESGESIEVFGNGSKDGIIAKFNADLKLIWAKTFISAFDDELFDGIETDNGFAFVGYINGTHYTKFTLENGYVLTANGGKTGIVIYTDINGNVYNHKKLGSSVNTIELNENGYVIGGESSGNIVFSEDETQNNESITIRKSSGNTYGFLIEFNQEDLVGNYIVLENSNYNRIYDIASYENIIYAIGIQSNETTINSKYTYDSNEMTIPQLRGSTQRYLLKINEGLKIENYNTIINDNISKVFVNADGNPMTLSNGYTSTLGSRLLYAEETENGEEQQLYSRSWTSHLIIYNNSLKVSKFFDLKFDSSQIAFNTIKLTSSGKYVLGGGRNVGGTSGAEIAILNKDYKLEGYYKDNNAASFIKDITEISPDTFVSIGKNNRYFSIYQFERIEKNAEIPEQKRLEVNNYKEKFNITTKVVEHEEIDDDNNVINVKGGSITGEEETVYEEVEYGGNSTKVINVTPSAGYEILYIKVNGEKIDFVPNDDGSYELELFSNVVSNKNIEAEFSNNISKIIVHHYFEGTEEKICPDEVFYGNIGEEYTTAPNTDIDGYEVNLDILPNNNSGRYTEQSQEVVYYYKPISVRLIVHHYLEGTTEEISSQGYESIKNKGDEYHTEKATDIEEKYELIEVPINAEGILVENETIVNYYYRIKEYGIYTKVNSHTEIDELGVQSEIEGGTISGKNFTPFETVKYGDDSIKDIIITPYEGYKIKEIYINEEKIEIDNPNQEFLLNKFINVKSNIYIVVLFEKKEGSIIVHHYIEGTEEKVPSNTGGVVEDEIKTGYIGDNYITKPSNEIYNGYELVNSPNNRSGIYSENIEEIIYYYNLKKCTYKVEYYYNDVLDEEKTEYIETRYDTLITEYMDKPKTGYKYSHVETLPLIVTDVLDNNIIKVYYNADSEQTKELNYKIEFYKSNDLQENDTQVVYQTVQVLDPDIVTIDFSIIDNNKYLGYFLDRTEPENLPDKINSDSIIKLYYKKDIFNYKVEYYYNDVKDETLTEEKSAEYEEIITEYVDKVKEGYKLKEEVIPLKISANEEENIMKVYYVTDEEQTKELSYIVEYYKDGVLQDNDTQIEKVAVQLLDGNILDVDKAKINGTNKYEGYTFEKTEPETIPDTVTDGEIIKVYYIKTKYPYKVEYYYNNIKDELLTEIGECYKDDVIENYVNKPKEGYEFEEIQNMPLTITENVETNVIKVYYLPIRKITINHIDKNNPNIIIETEEKQGKEGYTITTSEKDFDGYILVEKPDVEEYTYKDEEQVVNYYYAKVSTGVLEKHLNVITGDPVADSKSIEGYEGKLYTTSEKEVDGYKIATNKEYYEMIARENENFLVDNGVSSVEEYLTKKNITPSENYIPSNKSGTMAANLIEVKYYYIPKVKLTVKYIDILTGEEIKEEVEGELIDSTVNKIGEVDEPYVAEAKEFDKYLKVSNKAYYKLFLLTHPEVLEEENVTTLEEYLEKKNIDPKAEYVPDNKEGNLKIMLNDDGTYSDEIIVTYYYGPEREVTVKYYDKVTREEISEEVVKVGPDGEFYDLSSEDKELEGYTLVEEPSNLEGIYEEINETRKFYYAKNTKVIVKYVDKDTGTVIDSSKNYNIEGYEGKEYRAEKKDFANYNFVEDTNNTEGIMKREEIQVVYYYSKVKEPTNNDDNNDSNNNDIPTTPTKPTNQTEPKNETNTSNTVITNNEQKASPISTVSAGDILPIVVYCIIATLIVVNIIIANRENTKTRKRRESRIAKK